MQENYLKTEIKQYVIRKGISAICRILEGAASIYPIICNMSIRSRQLVEMGISN